MSWKSLIVAAFVVVGCVSAASAQSNHYLCRQVKDLKSPKFVAQTGIVVSDETAGDTCDLKKPFLLCDPADANGSGVPDATLHLCCYKAKCTAKPAVSYQITDQFGTLTIQTKKPKFLCNPCATGPLVACNMAYAPACNGECPQGQKCTSFGFVCGCF